jgi:hypothetical protein
MSTPEPQEKKRLWESSAEFDEVWKNRIHRMASYIEGPATVADFGCGMMWLEEILPKSFSYVPIDYIRRDERTIVLDLNRDTLDSVQADTAFLSGVLEYVEDVPGFVTKLAENGFQQIVLSYCLTEKHPNLVVRKTLNWVSHLSVLDLLSAFLRYYTLTAIDDVKTNTICVFKRKPA